MPKYFAQFSDGRRLERQAARNITHGFVWDAMDGNGGWHRGMGFATSQAGALEQIRRATTSIKRGRSGLGFQMRAHGAIKPGRITFQEIVEARPL